MYSCPQAVFDDVASFPRQCQLARKYQKKKKHISGIMSYGLFNPNDRLPLTAGNHIFVTLPSLLLTVINIRFHNTFAFINT